MEKEFGWWQKRIDAIPQETKDKVKRHLDMLDKQHEENLEDTGEGYLLPKENTRSNGVSIMGISLLVLTAIVVFIYIVNHMQ